MPELIDAIDLDSAPQRSSFERGQFTIRPSDALHAKPSTILFGLPLVNAALHDVAVALVERASRAEQSIIQFVNAHCINTLRRSKTYSRALSQAAALLPDGSGLSIAAKLAGTSFEANLNGTDLFPILCEEAARAGQTLFLLGGKPGVPDKVVSRMRAKGYQTGFAGCHHGYFDESETQALIDQINRSGATILLVGMGVPHQEIWIAKHRGQINSPVILGVGGLFDYYSGAIARAPAILRKMGCEWVWRFLQEPRRLGRRYLVGNLHFLMHAARWAAEQRGIPLLASKIAKRVLDLALALTALIAASPVFIAAALAIKLEDGGPVFFRQTRIGAGGKPFRMWKFRSMGTDAEARRKDLLALSERDSMCFKMKRDPRITSIGRLLRRTSLDELPQLFNVLRGQMSIVGPRPALPQEVVAYEHRAWARLSGQPGLTCTWQVSGRANIPFAEQVELDIDYLEQRSIRKDLSLIMRTVPAVLSGDGAY